MLKSTVKSIAVLLTSLAVVVSVCQSASAQLNVGQRKVQRGLEREYLQYQLGQRNLSDMLVIPGCIVGSGTGCNKTGTVLQQILTMNGGPSYYDLAIRAAGGKSNFDAFSAYYGNNPRLLEVPFASFWKGQSPQVMDGYQYVLGQSVSNRPVLGLGAVTKNFTWSPISRGDNSLSPRQGLLDFKYAFGRELLLETSKVPNLEQQIRSLDLPPEMTQFYLNNLSNGINALNTGNNAALQESILRIVSFPYSPNATTSGEYGRFPLGVPAEFNNLQGIPIVNGDVTTLDVSFLEGGAFIEASDTAVALDVGELAAGGGFNALPFIGGGFVLALLLLTLGGDGGGNSSSNPVTPLEPNNPSVPTPPTPQCPNPDGSGGGGGGGVIGVLPCDNPTPPIVKPVDEPSAIKAILLLTIVMCILSRKQRAIQLRN